VAPLAGGTILLDGVDISGRSTPHRFHAGIARTFQIPEIVTEMTVLENVLLGCRRERGTSLLHQTLRLPAYRRRERRARDRALEMLELVGLAHRADRLGGQLPLGDIRLLELARVLLSEPRLVLLDELASGLTDDELGPLERGLDYARETLSATVVLVEHNIEWVMTVTDRIQVLAEGQPLAAGSPDEIRQDARVIDAYLGSRHG
jgi:ABC-type branched-subunit amino acid transport system ATPase component